MAINSSALTCTIDDGIKYDVFFGYGSPDTTWSGRCRVTPENNNFYYNNRSINDDPDCYIILKKAGDKENNYPPSYNPEENGDIVITLNWQSIISTCDILLRLVGNDKSDTLSDFAKLEPGVQKTMIPSNYQAPPSNYRLDVVRDQLHLEDIISVTARLYKI